MANGLQGLTKHLALCLSGGRSGKNRPRYSTTIHLYVCQQVDVEILVISYLRVTQGTLIRTFEGTSFPRAREVISSEIIFSLKYK